MILFFIDWDHAVSVLNCIHFSSQVMCIDLNCNFNVANPYNDNLPFNDYYHCLMVDQNIVCEYTLSFEVET